MIWLGGSGGGVLRSRCACLGTELKKQQNLVAAFDAASPEPLERVKQALDRLGLPWKETGRGLRSCCPAHETAASDPSCDFDLGRDGRVLVTCRSASCSFESIVEALGVEARELFADTSTKTATTRTTRPKAPPAEDQPLKLGTLADVAKVFGKGRQVEPHIYRDDDGREVIGAFRISLAGGDKEFRQAHVGADGSWFSGIGPWKNSLRPLYELRHIRESAEDDATVFVVEGERCVEWAQKLELVATTTIGGAGKAKNSDLSPLRGRRVVVLPDNDKAGRDHARDVAERAITAGAREVRVVELPGLQPKEDLVEWVEARDAESIPRTATRAELEELVAAASPFEAKQERQDVQQEPEIAPRPRFRTVGLADLVKRPPVPWLCKNLIPAQGVTVLAGAPKTGKSFVLVDLMLALAHGREMWMGRTLRKTREPAGVLYLCLEGHNGVPGRVRGWQAANPAERLVGRFEMLDDFDLPGALLGEAGAPLTEAWLTGLAAAWQAEGAPLQVVVIDTLAQSSEGAENKTEEMAPVMRALARVAKRLAAAVVVVHHLRKSHDGKWRELVLDEVRGTTGIVGAADVILGLQKDKTGTRILLSNLGTKDGPGFEPVCLELRSVTTGENNEDGTPETSAYIVESELPSPQSDDPAKQSAKDAENRERLLRAAEGLLDLSSAKELCKAAGIRPENQRLVAAMATGADAVLVAVPYAAGRYRYGTPATVERWQQAKQGAKGNHAEPKGQESSEHGSDGSHGSMVPAPRTPLRVGNPRGDGVQESGPQDRDPRGNHAEPCGTQEPSSEDEGRPERTKGRRRRAARTAGAGGES